MTVIIDTVHGSKSAKIQSTGMDGNPYYGTCSEEPVFKLRQILNYLLIQGHLILTDAQYPVLELTESSYEVLDGKPVFMKVAKEQPKKPGKKEQKPQKTLPDGGEVDRNLFEKLRSLRMEIAKKEKVPPYIVFSDKTLLQMCRIRPKNKEEMMTVSGVGEMKYAKYGEAFLEALR